MADSSQKRSKRKNVEPDGSSKRLHSEQPNSLTVVPSLRNTAGKVQRIFVRNFMCHDALEIVLNPNVNFIIGSNGSGKSALLTALTVGLGGRASITNRGTSIKEFIKKGRNSATIEVTLMNQGPTAFMEDIYGNSVTVARTIGATSSYRLKNFQGKTISTKKSDLDALLTTANIQIENPICILNQDVSRTFLATSTASDKYHLFMRATRMETIVTNYKNALTAAEESYRRLETAQEYVAENKKQVESLEESLKMIESAESARAEVANQELHLAWALAIAEEARLTEAEQALAVSRKALSDIEENSNTRQTKREELTTKIRELSEKIRETRNETSESSRAHNAIKERYLAEKESYTNKHREWKSSESKTKRLEDDISLVCQEIKRLESTNDGEKVRYQMRQKVAKMQQELDEVEAMLRTKQTDEMHLSSDKLRLEQDERAAAGQAKRCDMHVRNTKQQLASLKQQSDSTVTIFGADMPRLLKRIDEEFLKGRFKEKPIGPLGVYIKIKDSAWTPAIESYLGERFLSSFAVDNTQDANTLSMIFNDILRSGRRPQIISSKFFHEVHDISAHCTRTPNLPNLLDIMEISEPVVANCLIDQREVECVLLTPTSAEAAELMSDRTKVPRNCKRALTQNADEFFPDPNYRTYGGKVGRTKFLQVSTTEAIQALAEELGVAEDELNVATKQHRNFRDKLQRNQAELATVTSQVIKLRTMQHKIKSTIDGMAEELDLEEPDGTAVFIAEKEVLEKKLEEQRAAEKVLAGQVEAMQVALKSLEQEMKSSREIVYMVGSKVDELKEEIRKLEEEREMLNLNTQHATRKLAEARGIVQKCSAELEVQKRVTVKVVNDASALGERVDVRRSVVDIKRVLTGLKVKIAAVEQRVGSRDDLEVELATMRAKYNGVIEFANAMKASNDKHLLRVRERQKNFKDVKRCVGAKVQAAFSGILSLRQYKGSIQINYAGKAVDLEVIPQNTAKRSTNDARTLSGGERSYSTVAFILALWDCMDLPFYFLDEFDVFMDKVNRRIIMDILMDHARSHPQSQFAFLTPLDTSIARVDDFLTIHRLAPPERNDEAEN